MEEYTNKVYTMVRNAWDFQEAAYRCKEPMMTKTTDVGKVLFIAEMSNIAFACEIYLKTIYFIINKCEYKKCHELHRIFNKLSDEYKNWIIKKTNIEEQEFYRLLNKNSKYFEKWRYYHEEVWQKSSNEIDDSFLICLCESLHNICMEIIKNSHTNCYLYEININ